MKRIALVLVSLLIAASSAVQAGHKKEKDPVLAKVNGKKIRQSTVYKELWLLSGRKVLEQKIQQTLIEQEARRLKLKPDKKEVDERLKGIQEQLPDGTKLDDRLQIMGLTKKQLVDELTYQVVREAVVERLADVSVTQDEVKSVFEANKERLGTPEAVRVRHIMVQSQLEAEDLLVALRAGADFAKLAKVKSMDAGTKNKGGDMGFIPRGVFRPEIEQVVFQLKPGETSRVVQATQGYHIFQVIERREANPAAFKDVKEDIRVAIRNQKLTKALPGVVQKLKGKAKIEILD